MLWYANEMCNNTVYPLLNEWYSYPDSLSSNCINRTVTIVETMELACNEIEEEGWDRAEEDRYSEPMVLIGIYISIASLFCVLAMALDLLQGFRNRKFWFPTKYFSLNAASITVITVAMKLPVDLSSSMDGGGDQFAKLGGLAFMCTMMSNLMPSLASMDNKSLMANVIGLSILVITLVVNVGIQISTKVITHKSYFISTKVITHESYFILPFFFFAYAYMGLLLFLLIILIASAITIPTSKNVLEWKYQAASKTILNDQENTISTLMKLRQLVKRYWIMIETSSPQFVMASNPLSFASGVTCALSMVLYLFVLWQLKYILSGYNSYRSVYQRSMKAIVITQFLGVVVGSVAPILRCFMVLRIRSFAKENKIHFLVFKVEKYWTQMLCDWKENRISFFSSSPIARRLFHYLKTRILSFCIGVQKVIVVSSKLIGLLPVVVMILFIYLKSILLLFSPSSASTSDDAKEDLSNYVLLLDDNFMPLAQEKMKEMSDSMHLLIQKAEKKQHKKLLKFLELSSVAFNGVEKFDNDQSQLSVEHVNSWSLPIISLTCIAVTIPNIGKDRIDNLLKSVGEGLLYTHLVEESLNKAAEYVNIRRATVKLWHEVEDNCKWLETSLKRSTYEGKTPTEIIKSFSHNAQEVVTKFNRSTNGEVVQKERLHPKVIVGNTMYRIAETIMHTYESNNLDVIEEELFTRLSHMIADILAACLTNIPQVVTLKCHESVIEKREASVLAAIDLLGRTTKILKRLETHELPDMDPDKIQFIDEWRLHLKKP